MFEIVKKAIGSYNPCEISPQTPDEYDNECREIALKINERSGADEIADVIYKVFTNKFGKDFPKSNFILSARDIIYINRAESMGIPLEYLDKLIADTNEKRSRFAYFEPDETDAEISYLSSKKDTDLGLKNGLMYEMRRQNLKVKEHPNLRKGSKHYLKTVRQNNRIVKITSFIRERIDVVFLAYYEADARYFFPFSSNGTFYPTYTYVTRYAGGIVSEEYKVGNIQVVYERYEKTDNEKTRYSVINYVKNGTYPILGSGTGVFECDPAIVYTETEYRLWIDDRVKNV